MVLWVSASYFIKSFLYTRNPCRIPLRRHLAAAVAAAAAAQRGLATAAAADSLIS